MMDSKKKLNREKTIHNIVEKAKDYIKDIDKLKTEDDDFLVEAAMLWEAEIVYE
jgi:hypothetical protein